MLNKELLRYKIVRGAVKVNFIDPAAPDHLSLAQSLLGIYRDGAGQHKNRGEIAEDIDLIVKGAADTLLAQGLNKLILDRCQFEIPLSCDYALLRRETFTAGAKMLKRGTTLETYRQALNPGKLYGDLEENETLQQVDELYPSELLQRYNVALVQGLLLYANTLDFQIGDEDAAKLRKVFKYLKFFRLLAEIRQAETITMQISGPYSIFANSRKYALQLAAFFPAILDLPQWRLTAEIKIGGKAATLKLDESAKLVSHYRNFSAFVPEEIKMFHRLFKEKIKDWEITGDTPAIRLDGNEIMFPDLSFKHGKTVVHLELFHRWHHGPLHKRLQYFNDNALPGFIFGVDRAIADETELKNYHNIADRIFLFRDFPGVERVHQLLNNKYHEKATCL